MARPVGGDALQSTLLVGGDARRPADKAAAAPAGDAFTQMMAGIMGQGAPPGMPQTAPPPFAMPAPQMAPLPAVPAPPQAPAPQAAAPLPALAVAQPLATGAVPPLPPGLSPSADAVAPVPQAPATAGGADLAIPGALPWDMLAAASEAAAGLAAAYHLGAAAEAPPPAAPAAGTALADLPLADTVLADTALADNSLAGSLPPSWPQPEEATALLPLAAPGPASPAESLPPVAIPATPGLPAAPRPAALASGEAGGNGPAPSPTGEALVAEALFEQPAGQSGSLPLPPENPAPQPDLPALAAASGLPAQAAPAAPPPARPAPRPAEPESRGIAAPVAPQAQPGLTPRALAAVPPPAAPGPEAPPAEAPENGTAALAGALFAATLSEAGAPPPAEATVLPAPPNDSPARALPMPAHPAAPLVATLPDRPAPAASPQPRSHIAAQAAPQIVLRSLQAGEAGLDSISIDLTPPELGRVGLRMTFQEGGSVQVAMLAERAETFEALRQERHSLVQQMEQAGLNLGGGGLDLQHGRLPQPAPEEMAASRPDLGGGEEEVDAAGTTMPRSPASDSLIDIIA
jgi:hypothetical protein